MNKLLVLNAILRLYHANFLNLHWNSKGEEFNDAHKSISTEYYELCEKYIDLTAEMAARLGGNPLNYVQVAIFAQKEDKPLVDSKILYTRKQIIEYADCMLGDVIVAIKACLEDSCMENTINAGIKSDLEAMLNDFDIQYRYINKRRMM